MQCCDFRVRLFSSILLATVAVAAVAGSAFTESLDVAPHNRLTEQEQAEGWKLLFDGKTTSGWRGFLRDEFPSHTWIVQGRTLMHDYGEGRRGGDIITVGTFSEFDLRFDWRIDPAGNSGVKYFVLEERGETIGHEYQLLGPEHRAAQTGNPKYRTAGFYDVFPPSHVNLRPNGEFNSSRILVQGNRVEHWLNGERVLEYELGSEEVLEAVAESKFKDVEGFGTLIPGHILLQDHRSRVWFRNMKILDLSSRAFRGRR